MGDRDTGEITVLAVLPGYERRGIGRTLMGLASMWLFSTGHDELWLTSNSDPSVRAHRFYLHLGWVSREAARHGDEVLILGRSAQA
jgi:GNAT superfamily N-acetyltransferase